MGILLKKGTNERTELETSSLLELLIAVKKNVREDKLLHMIEGQ
jgi:hypothetical protein